MLYRRDSDFDANLATLLQSDDAQLLRRDDQRVLVNAFLFFFFLMRR